MNTDPTFFEKLRAAREAAGFTLDDVSQTTLIDLKYLRAIEAGEEALLPEAYLRAFIREYAAAIGLDPADVMHQHDQASHPAEPAAVPVQSVPDTPATMPTPPAPHHAWWTHRATLLSAISVVTVCIIAVILYFTRSSGPPAVHEIPFGTTVAENQRRAFPNDTTTVAAQPAPATPRDSLQLSVATIDSVWMQLSIDGTPPNDYLFPPNVRRRWKAKEKFTVTLGNAGGMLFRLNTTDLGTVGKPGSVVRNLELNRRSLTSPPGRSATP